MDPGARPQGEGGRHECGDLSEGEKETAVPKSGQEFFFFFLKPKLSTAMPS